MAEDTFLKMGREFFAREEASDLDITEKKLNKILERYNRALQKSLFGASPYVAEDLRLTIVKSTEEKDERK
jgi:hypothetical protein